ncbi:MAG: toll/interleukin-1 receptor domain-containing protein [Ilumatobacteraceae bacterium]
MEAGLRPFLDQLNLTPGRVWQHGLLEAMAASASIAVFVGPNGVGRCHHKELLVGLDHAARSSDEFRVIPVLLPGAEPATLQSFLAQRTWVDFRSGLDGALALTRLAAAVRGEAIIDSPSTV